VSKAGDLAVVPMTAAHWPGVERIYRDGIATGHATFESEPPTWDAFDSSRLPGHRHVALDVDGRVVGWAAAVAVSDRCAYAGVIEHSVYVAPAAQRVGVGRLLLDALVTSAEAAGIWTIQSGVFPENTASLAMHERAGFRVVGTRSRLGEMTYGPMAGAWRDVVLIERRSRIVGA
jgi:L-amino acid N-acyltransferase YncA